MTARHNACASRIAAKRGHIWILIAACASVMACAVFAAAQTRDLGSIEGIVTDPSGAVVAGVAMKARIAQTSATFTATTNEDGLF